MHLHKLTSQRGLCICQGSMPEGGKVNLAVSPLALYRIQSHLSGTFFSEQHTRSMNRTLKSLLFLQPIMSNSELSYIMISPSPASTSLPSELEGLTFARSGDRARRCPARTRWRDHWSIREAGIQARAFLRFPLFTQARKGGERLDLLISLEPFL